MWVKVSHSGEPNFQDLIQKLKFTLYIVYDGYANYLKLFKILIPVFKMFV